MKTRDVFMFGSLIIAMSVVALLALQPTMLTRIFETEGFEPHGHCFLWMPTLTRMYAISDTLIGMSYMVISVILTWLVYKASRNIPFPWVFLAFGAFIFTCGLTHFMDVWMLWTPVFWLGGYVKATTAIASVTTAVLLPPLMPKVLRVIDNARKSEQRKLSLIAANEALQAEIAERQRVEAELRAALEREHELNLFRANFVSRMSHEFRTPMAIAYTSSELLKNYHHRLTEEQKSERIDKIQQEIRNMTDLLDDILMIGKLEAGRIEFRPTPIDLEALCREAVEDVRLTSESNHRFVFAVEGDCGTAVVDEKLILQIIYNLLTNAVKYSPKGGEIYFSMRCDGEQIEIRVQDHGIGIPSEDVGRIFEGFFRAQNTGTISGTGLGLAIARYGAEAHGGSLILESTSPEGTTFLVRVPLVRE